MTKGPGHFFLGGKFAEAQVDGHKPEVLGFGQGDAKDGFVATEDDTETVLIDEPKLAIDESLAVHRRFGEAVKKRRGVWRIHTY